MAITANWTAVSGSTGYKLYRQAGAKVDLTNLPADVVSVAADKTTYQYPTSVSNTLYYVVVASTDANGLVTFSDQIMIGYYPDTGPGPSTLLRGDWSFGFFGEVAVTDVASPNEIYASAYALKGSSALSPQNAWSVYYKCIVAGRIIFIPDNAYANNGPTFETLRTAGFALADYSYEANGVKVARNGFEFVTRVAHATAGPLTTIIADPTKATDDISRSELGMFIALFGGPNAPGAVPAVAGNVPYTKYRLGDYAVSTYQNTLPTDTFINAQGSGVVAAAAVSSATVSTITTATSSRANLVLELLF